MKAKETSPNRLYRHTLRSADNQQDEAAGKLATSILERKMLKNGTGENSMRICVVGAGAIGGFMGAKLALAGQDVTLIARVPWTLPTSENAPVSPSA